MGEGYKASALKGYLCWAIRIYHYLYAIYIINNGEKSTVRYFLAFSRYMYCMYVHVQFFLTICICMVHLCKACTSPKDFHMIIHASKED